MSPTVAGGTLNLESSRAAAPAQLSGRNLERRRRTAWRAALRETESDTAPDPIDFAAILAESEPAYGLLSSEKLDLRSVEFGLDAYAAAHLRLAARHLVHLAEQCRANDLPIAPDVFGGILAAFRERLNHALTQSASLLFNVARLKGEISGETLAERTQTFSRLLLQPGYRKACGKRFPVLDEVLAAVTTDAMDSWSEFFARLQADRAELDRVLPGGLSGVKGLRFYAGDPHNRGRSVVIVEDQAGMLVYKPRSLDTDAVFERTIAWLNGKLPLGLAHPRLLRREGYGWTSFVPAADCADLDEVRRCFERCGALVAILFVLGGSDVHHENIICSGATPFIVDVEALLNGPLAAPTRAQRRRQLARIESVVNTCYPPTLMAMGESHVDITGAGYRAGQTIEFKRSIQPDEAGELKARPVTVTLPPSANLPTLNGVPQDAEVHLDSLIAGFRTAMQAIIDHREEFLTRGDLFPSFASATSRFIPRATAQYNEIIRNALHPHACVSRAAHDQALSVLAAGQGWSAGVERRLLAADLRAIRRGDIPFFKSRADSTSLWTADGEEIPHAFQESGHRSVARRVVRLNAREVESQVDMLRLAFSASASRLGSGKGRGAHRRAVEAGGALRLRTASDIGDRLLSRAIQVPDGIFWLGRTNKGDRFTAAILEAELYGGNAGIGLFMAELARITGERRYRNAALKCQKTYRGSAFMRVGGLGAFEGATGLVYADLAISRAIGVEPDPRLGDILARVTQLVPDDRSYDIVAGSAGALLVALRARAEPQLSSVADDLAHACAAHLMASATEVDDALAWPLPRWELPLTGLAHGACGAGLALAEYAAVFDEEAAWTAAYKALDYARASFDPRTGAWRDLRHEEGYMMAWCHGAPGMALARQRVVELDPTRATPQILLDIERGLAAVAEKAGPESDTFCHGRCGNWEPLWRGDARHRRLADQEVATLCADWARGVPLGGDLSEPTPDLMNGLAGVGLQILRSVDPAVPCVGLLA